MLKEISPKMSRAAWGSVLVIAAVAAVAGAWLLERLGLRSAPLRPLTFVGTVVGLKLGLFAFWPVLTSKGKSIITMYKQPRPSPSPMKLWNERDPRVDVSLFAGNVPTFVLNQEQRFIDWNPAFELVFGGSRSVKRGGHVSHWYELLDNFRRVPKRTDALYGEGILPITDRERATYISKEFGRMVFTKIMAPIIDRRSGRILGWSVALNINSVNKRQEFFEKLHAAIAMETKRMRYAAAYDGLFAAYPGRRALHDRHLAPLSRLPEAARVLELGCGTGSVTLALLGQGYRVTAVEKETHQLRQAKDRCELFMGPGGRVRLVRQDPDDLHDLPSARYDGCVIMHQHRLHDVQGALARAYEAMRPGAVLTVSAILNTGGIDAHFNAVRAELEAAGRYDALKHQFNHVVDYERELAQSWRLPAREDVRAAVLEAGFVIDEEQAGLEDGHTLLLVAHK